MKKLLIILPLLLLFSCDETATSEEERRENESEYWSNVVQKRSRLISVSFDGNTHEILISHISTYGWGMTHWPDCKYCESNNKDNE